MTTTNGHPIPNPKPGDLTPAVRPVKRTLYLEEEDNGITSAWEATDDDLVEECKRRGVIAGGVYLDGKIVFGGAVPPAPGSAVFRDVGGRLEIDAAQDGPAIVVPPIVGTTPSGEA